MRKKCRHQRTEWRRCGCSWYATVDGVTHNLGADERAAARLAHDLSVGAGANVETFAVVAQRWLRTIEGRRRPRTASIYRTAVEHLDPRVGHFPVDRVTAAAILEAEGRMTLDLAPNTMRGIRQVAMAVLRFARDCGLVEAVPDLSGGRYRQAAPAEPAHHLPPDRMRAVLAAAPADLRECMRFGYLTGLRPAELIAVEHGDLVGQVVQVRRQIVQATGAPGPLKTAHSRRDVDLSPAAAACIPTGGQGRLWPVRYGVLLDRWHAALAAAGEQGCGPHALRHSNAALRFAAGQPIPYVSAQLGHASPAITLRVYAHVIPGPRQDPGALDEVAGL